MSISKSDSYAAAGVDVTAGYESTNLIKPMVESTYIPVSYTHLDVYKRQQKTYDDLSVYNAEISARIRAILGL